MCRKTKGLEEFAKSQRNKPDKAVTTHVMLGLDPLVDYVTAMLQVHGRPSQYAARERGALRGS